MSSKPRSTPAQREYSNRVILRNRLLREAGLSHLRGAARKATMDELESKYVRLRRWTWTFDHTLGTQDRPAFKLYKAAIKLRVQQLRANKQHDTARMLEGHLNSLHDVAPRAAWCYYPAEWKEISQALRPFGSRPPRGGKAAQLYAIYQRIIRTRQVEELT